ncbi:hypothetical protein [Couchioplanes azureus]|uniref:hypothetical protein n=1 Tax=Couchioplanes caeruleus TaxID=56438 RepID=UPI001670E768|nr:hypothetical protein [Couchioplanes caeruleus]GGQ75808.1 hypothetical protein GCM10010166_52410 [Couchioplanes caeruleus subsp. azureus]
MSTPALAGPGRHAVYTGRVTNWPMVVLSAALLAPLLILGSAGGGDWSGVAVPLLVAAAGLLLNLLTVTSVRTAAGPNGVSVRYGVLGWPRLHYRIEEIADAEVVDLPGWYVVYGFWWTPRRTCCTLRSGPTLRLTLRTGRTVTVTVPDPGAAVAAIREARPA